MYRYYCFNYYVEEGGRQLALPLHQLVGPLHHATRPAGGQPDASEPAPTRQHLVGTHPSQALSLRRPSGAAIAGAQPERAQRISDSCPSGLPASFASYDARRHGPLNTHPTKTLKPQPTPPHPIPPHPTKTLKQPQPTPLKPAFLLAPGGHAGWGSWIWIRIRICWRPCRGFSGPQRSGSGRRGG